MLSMNLKIVSAMHIVHAECALKQCMCTEHALKMPFKKFLIFFSLLSGR
jgi:hypothetical protein